MAQSKVEKIASIEQEIKQLKERQKQLQQQHNLQERKDRTKRLCKRAGLFESMLPDTIPLTDEQFKTFLEKTILTDMAHKTLSEIASNSFYIMDDAKQREKMTEEFYSAVKKTIPEYLERADYFIKSGSQSPSVMERWVLKIQALEEKKRHYEDILRRELTGLDDKFATLKFLAQELSLRAQGIRFRKSA